MALPSFKRWFERLFKHRKNADHGALEPLETAPASVVARPYNEPHRVASICLLPEDVLFMICQYLTPGEVITLMLSYAGFWRQRDKVGIFADVWQRITQPGNDPSKMGVRFYALRMLEYDGLLRRGSASKYCCWGCMKAHERRCFSSAEFRKRVDLQAREDFLPPEESRRSCPLGKRCIFFTPLCEMNLMQIRQAVTHPPTKNPGNYIDAGVTNIYIHPLDPERFVQGDNVLRYRIPLGPTQISFSNFRRIAKCINYPLCPHVRTSDEEVIQLYYQPVKPGYSCKSCQTNIQVSFQSGTYATVFRHLGSLCSPSDPIWLAQSYKKRNRPLKWKFNAVIL